MTVRRRIALTIFLTGVVTALGVIITVVLAFQRFEHESRYDRGNAFLGRVLAQHDDILDLHARNPAEFRLWLKSLLLFEPDTQLYLLAFDGTVLASTGQAQHSPGFKVALAPVRAAVAAAQDKRRAPYVMGDDPEHMQADAVIVARMLQRALIRRSDEAAGYLYLVAQSDSPREGRLELFRSSLAGPALLAVLAVIVLTTGLAAWIVATVTRPLHSLSQAVAAAARDGFNTGPAMVAHPPPVPAAGQRARKPDEFGQLHNGFAALLATLRQQWESLRTLDRFRREGVSNLSHDLRSPLTATVACLETLERRWAAPEQNSEPAAVTRKHSDSTAATAKADVLDVTATANDRQLVTVALRNARNAAQLVRSLGDLALLDEPEFKLKAMRLDVGEVLDDIALRFADRALQQGVGLSVASGMGLGTPAVAEIDIELFERAVANLIDNALKFTPAGGRITLSAQLHDGQVQIGVADTGAGIAPDDQTQLFDRLFQGADARSHGGKGLGLAIVKRIAELHRGGVALASPPGDGTTVTISLPAA